jgi:hypothetical protein
MNVIKQGMSLATEQLSCFPHSRCHILHYKFSFSTKLYFPSKILKSEMIKLIIYNHDTVV